MNNGIQLETGEPRHVVNRYMDLLFGKDKRSLEIKSVETIDDATLPVIKTDYPISSSEDIFYTRHGYNPHEYRWGDGAASILDYFLAIDYDEYPSAITTGQKVTLAVSVKFHKDFYRPILGVTIKTKEGVTVYGANSETLECVDIYNVGSIGAVIQIEITFTCRLAPGDYFISLGIATKHGEEIIPHDRRYDAIHLQLLPNTTFFGLADLELKMNVKKVVG